MERNVRLIQSNEALGTMKYVGGSFATEREAEAWAKGWFGAESRKRSFACMYIEVGQVRHEIIRGGVA